MNDNKLINMTDIKNYETFIKIEPINKGWSSDKKYYIETSDGRHLLLRMSDISQYDRKKEEFETMKRFLTADILMSEPVDFGICDNGKSVYILLTWCEGDDAEKVLPLLPEIEQFALGLEAGKILRRINSVSVTATSSDWANTYNKKIDRYIQNYYDCGIRFEEDVLLIDYINANRDLMLNRSMCLTHGDFHVGNLILSDDKKLSVIDFNRFKMVDPFHSFGAIVFSAAISPISRQVKSRVSLTGNLPRNFGVYSLFIWLLLR